MHRGRCTMLGPSSFFKGGAKGATDSQLDPSPRHERCTRSLHNNCRHQACQTGALKTKEAKEAPPWPSTCSSACSCEWSLR
eukprot:14914575-Alexandrium_andersonii.AAC.1